MIWTNDSDPFVCQWLANLTAAGELSIDKIDERRIEDVAPEDLIGVTQAHFFAGIGGWPLAFQLAGWPEDREVWTGSCPCQPFSTAGRRKGTEDPRHLWPEWLRLIAERRPATIFGEQVASPGGRQWLSSLRADLEALDYAVGAADLCAAGVGAPHLRQRLYFVGYARKPRSGRDARAISRAQAKGNPQWKSARRQLVLPHLASAARKLGDADTTRLEGRRLSAGRRAGERSAWTPSDTIQCRDSRSRLVEPGTFPLAHGIPARVGRLRAYGNAIVPQVAAAFVSAFLDTEG